MNVYTDNRLTPEPWSEKAACLQVDPEMFFGEDGMFREDAKRLCNTKCEVVAECLAYALENRERWGVWGGLSEIERRRILTRRRVA